MFQNLLDGFTAFGGTPPEEVALGITKPGSMRSGAEIQEKVTIVVTTFERQACITRFLESVHKCFPSLRVIVSDASKESPYSDGSKPSPNVSWRLLPKERGHTVGAGRNFLLEQVQTEFFFLADDDHIVHQGTDIGRMLGFLEESEYDIVGGAQGRGKFGTAVFEKVGTEVTQRYYRFHEKIGPQLVSCDRVSNTFLARSSAVRRVLWEERVYANEHAEFFWRASRDGLKIAQMGGVWVDHDRKCEDCTGPFPLTLLGHRDRQYRKTMLHAQNLWGKPSAEAKELRRKFCLEKNNLTAMVTKKNPLDLLRLKKLMRS